MNLSTRRLNQNEVEALRKKKNNFLYSCAVKDKFGEMGIVGFFNLEIKGKKGIVRDFILSCRAFGRGIEKTMIYKMSKILKTKNISKIELNYKKTKKNKPCFSFLQKNFNKKGKFFFFQNDAKKNQPPSFISIK
jgi:FkbH-like protein